jgi:SNARE domain
MDRDRSTRAQTTLSNNRKRHDDIQVIEKQMLALVQLFQDLDAIVIQQEAAVETIDQRGEDVQQNVEQANVQLDTAITSARAARRKKFWCLGIARKSPKLQPYLCSDSLRYSSYHHHHSRGCRRRCFSPPQVVFPLLFLFTQHVDFISARGILPQHLQLPLPPPPPLQQRSDWLEIRKWILPNPEFC